MAEQAYAYVTLIPVAKGFQSAIAKELGGAKGVGQTAGKETGGRFSAAFKTAIKGVAIAATAATAAVGGVLASGFTRLSGIEEAQAKLVGLGNSTEDVSMIMDNALSAVRGTAFGMADAATIAASAVAAGVEPGEQLARYLKTTADAAYIAGAGLDEMGAILNKATTSGKAQNDVLGQLAERGIPIYQMLGDAAGVAAGEIFDLASQGEISSDMLMQALEGNLSGAALESGNTVAGAFANMQAAIQRVGANLLGPSFGYFKEFFLGVIAFLGPVEEKAKVVGQAIADFLGPAAQDFKRIVGQFSSGYLDMDGVLDRITAKIRSFFEDGGLTNAFETLAGYRETIFNAVLEAVPGILDAFMEFLPQLIDFFLNTMLPRMLEQMTIIIKELIELTVTLLPQLVDTLVDMIPELLDGAVELFNAIVDALIEITPLLIDAVIDLLPKITSSLLDMLPDIIDASMDLFEGIIEGLIDATPLIIDAVFDLIPVIIETLIENIPKIVEAGKDLLTGLATGIIQNAPRLLGEAVKSMGNNIVNGFKDFMGINSPATKMIPYGRNVSQGVAKGIEDETEAVVKAATNLGNAATSAVDKAIEEIESKFEVITNIPQMLSDGMEEAFEFTVAQARKMANEVEGFFAKFDESGKLLQSYSGYGVENLVPTVSGGMLDVGKITDTLNSLEKAGYSNVAEAAFGGSLQQAFDTILGQRTFYNPETGMQKTISGTITEEALSRVLGPGFEEIPKLDKSVEELTDVMQSLNDQVAAKGLTPFADGGLVTGPTAALIGEAGPEVVIPLNKFESMMGMGGPGKSINYYAAPNQSLDNEQALFQAMRRAKVVANW